MIYRCLLNFCFYLCLLLALSTLGQARREPSQDWQQLDTEHFSIIYPYLASSIAAETAELAETYYPRVSALFGSAPAGRTPIVLNIKKDIANGYAQSIFTKLEFYLAPPVDKTFGPNEPGWLESLVVHEFAHLCHGMRADQGTALWVTRLFGNLQGINFIAPQWWVEGAAVYAETELTQAGRGRNPYERMRLAANLLSDRPWSLAQIGVPSSLTIPWDRVYLPGYYILKQVEMENPGRPFLAEMCAEQSGWPFYGLSHTWKAASVASPAEIWQKLRQPGGLNWIQDFGMARVAMREAVTLTHETGHEYAYPCWEDSKTLLAYRTGVSHVQELVRVNIRTQAVTVVAKLGRVLGSLTYHAPTQRVYFARVQTDPIFTDSEVSDIFYRGLQGGEKQVTRQGHCWSPDVSCEGRIVCVQNYFGSTRLGLVDEGTGHVIPIPGPKQAVYSSPRWSPDGKTILAAVRLKSEQHLYFIDPITGGMKPVAYEKNAGDHDPTWSPDGSRILFVSDRSGTHQVHQYNLAEKTLSQVTEARLGVFYPALSADSKLLALAEYTIGNSQQLVIAPCVVNEGNPVLASDIQPENSASATEGLTPKKGQLYSAWPYMVPSFWMPMLLEEDGEYLMGALSARQDPLAFHTWLAQVYYHSRLADWFGEMMYENDETFSTLTFKAFTWPLSRQGTQPGGRSYQRFWGRKTGCEIRSTVPVSLIQADDRLTHVQVDAAYTAYQISMSSDERLDTNYSGVDGGIELLDITQAPRDLFPVCGYSIEVRGQMALPGHAYTGQAATASIQVFAPSPILQQAFVFGIRGKSQNGIFPDTTYATYPNRTTHWPEAEFGATVNAGYRLPLWIIDDGIGMLPIYFQALSAEGRFYWGTDELNTLSLQEWKGKMERAVELTLPLKLTAFWFVPFTVKPYAQYQLDQQTVWFGVNAALNLNF